MKTCAHCGWINLPDLPQLDRDSLRVIDPSGGSDLCGLCAGATVLRLAGHADVTLLIGVPVAELAV